MASCPLSSGTKSLRTHRGFGSVPSGGGAGQGAGSSRTRTGGKGPVNGAGLSLSLSHSRSKESGCAPVGTARGRECVSATGTVLSFAKERTKENCCWVRRYDRLTVAGRSHSFVIFAHGTRVRCATRMTASHVASTLKDSDPLTLLVFSSSPRPLNARVRGLCVGGFVRLDGGYVGGVGGVGWGQQGRVPPR
jgi:hypothetical protein